MAPNARPPISYEVHSTGLSRLAAHIGAQRRQDGLLNRDGANYCVVHWMLMPGARNALLQSLERRLTGLEGFELHLRAWAVPLDHAADRGGTLFVWDQLIIAGGPEDPVRDPRHQWLAGDVVYLHYATDRGSMACLAAVVEQDGSALPQP